MTSEVTIEVDKDADQVERQMTVLLVDDSSIYRTLVRRVLSTIPQVKVVAEATNGQEGVDLAMELKPDLLILDVEMPELDGIEVLEELARRKSPSTAIMLSTLTHHGAEATTEALMNGAFDFIHKPASKSMQESSTILRRELLNKIGVLSQSIHITTDPKCEKKGQQLTSPNRRSGNAAPPVEAICIGASTGGPSALKEILMGLPANTPVPIFVVQHMPPVFTGMLAKSLDANCELTVHEAVDKMVAENGNVYIAPGGKQMCLGRDPQDRVTICVNEDPPEKDLRPAVNYFFRSAAAIYGAKTAGIILTGMGCDGRDGAKLICEQGGKIFAQDEASCVVYGMPGSAVDAGIVDAVLPLNRIAEKIKTLISPKIKSAAPSP